MALEAVGGSFYGSLVHSFKPGGLKRLYERDDARRIPPQFVKKVRAILALLEQAEIPGDLDTPGHRLHPLKGHPGCWSVRVSANWRIVFRFKNSEAWDVD